MKVTEFLATARNSVTFFTKGDFQRIIKLVYSLEKIFKTRR